MAKTAEQIAKECECLTGEANRLSIRFSFLSQDESHFWPVCGKFNATKRAIKNADKFEAESGIYLEGLEYALFIEGEISRIVNSEV